MVLTKASGIIMGPISTLMGWIFNLIYNLFYGFNIYSIGFSIIVFTIIIRILIAPLSLKMTRSSKIQQYLQPEFNKITKKYKGKKDQDSMLKQQRELAELRSKYGIKTTSGCLTTIIQFPIMIALYNVINNVPAYVHKVRGFYEPIANAIFRSENGYTIFKAFVEDEANNKSFSRVTSLMKGGLAEFSSVTDATSEFGKNTINTIIDVLTKCNNDLLSKLGEAFSKNPEVGIAISNNSDSINQANNFFGINLSDAPGLKISLALIIPIASFIFQYLSMKVMPMQKTGDEQQDQMAETMRKTMIFMPIMSFFFTIIAPAGLGLYWATSALVGMLITIITNKYYEKADMEKLVAKQIEKAEAIRQKKGNKKSFMERMMDSAYGNSQSEEAEHARGMNKYSNTNLKNYTSPTAYKNENQSDDVGDRTDTGKKYRAGSISARANSVRDYNNKGE